VIDLLTRPTAGAASAVVTLPNQFTYLVRDVACAFAVSAREYVCHARPNGQPDVWQLEAAVSEDAAHVPDDLGDLVAQLVAEQSLDLIGKGFHAVGTVVRLKARLGRSRTLAASLHVRLSSGPLACAGVVLSASVGCHGVFYLGQDLRPQPQNEDTAR